VPTATFVPYDLNGFCLFNGNFSHDQNGFCPFNAFFSHDQTALCPFLECFFTQPKPSFFIENLKIMYKSLKNRYRPERQWPCNAADPFPIEGEHLVLQFINTYRNRGGVHRKEYIENYADFLSWCHEFGIMNLEEYNTLVLEGNCYQDEACFVWQRAIKLREKIYEYIYCNMRDKPVHEDVADFLNETIAAANNHLRLELVDNKLQVVWYNMHEELAWPLWVLAKHGIALLQSEEFGYIKKCSCGKFYLDNTRNKNRRWCNPLVCGNSVRSKKYYAMRKGMAAA